LASRPKNRGSDQHGEQRLHDYPGDADGGLLVADFDVAPDEEKEQLAILPEFIQAQLKPCAGRLNAQGLRARRAVRQRAGCGRVGSQ